MRFDGRRCYHFPPINFAGSGRAAPSDLAIVDQRCRPYGLGPKPYTLIANARRSQGVLGVLGALGVGNAARFGTSALLRAPASGSE